jgi:hypothetical protein
VTVMWRNEINEEILSYPPPPLPVYLSRSLARRRQRTCLGRASHCTVDEMCSTELKNGAKNVWC